MLKWLMVIGVIAVVYFFFIKKKPIRNFKTNLNESKSKPKANDMVECSSCGIYCEVSDCILSNGKYYCSKECAKES